MGLLRCPAATARGYGRASQAWHFQKGDERKAINSGYVGTQEHVIK